MRRWSSFGVFLTLSVASAFCARMASRHTPTGALVADEPYKSVGTLRQGEIARAVFMLTNDSTEPMWIGRMIPNCACTMVDRGPSELSPGDSMRVQAEFRVGNARGRTYTSLNVPYKLRGEKRTSALELRIVADVEPDFEVSATSLRFVESEKSSVVLALKPNVWSDLRVVGVEASHPAFKISVLDSVGPREEWRIEVSFVPEVPRSDLFWAIPQNLLVRTNSPREPIFRARLDVLRN